MAKILVADDEPGLREFVSEVLEQDGHHIVRVADGEEAMRVVDKQRFELVVTDLKMPKQGGMALLRKLRAEQPEVEVIVLTAHGTVDTAVEAMKLGAFDYLQKPLAGPEELSLLVARALERRRFVDAAARTRVTHTSHEPRLSYGDPAMAPVVQAIDKVARTTATVLLLGESGTGKEVAARAIHAKSDRGAKPFMAVNCAVLTDTLLESELFGHEKGAFTGATEQRRGRIELADGGTFFLDEVGELRPEIQAKLLRVVQDRRFERLGGSRTIEADVRWIAATNRDLRAMIDAGTFREDLYHRLALFPIRLPPLRERPKDLVPLAHALLAEIAPRLGRRGLTLAPDAEHRLAGYRWPGNVRELANTLERAAILADGPRIEASHVWLEPSRTGDTPAAASAAAAAADAPARSLVEVEKDAIDRALRSVGGNRRRAAELLGIGERTLYEKIKRYGLE